MNLLIRSCLIPLLIITISSSCFATEENDQAQITELDAYWAAVSQSVASGDFEAYSDTFHDDAVLVSGISQTSYPIADALAKWKSGFEDTKNGELKANVEFRFSQRIGDKTTAHETGIFLYSTTDQDGKSTTAYIHFESLLVKKDGKWLAMMEYQKSKATPEQWEALAYQADR